MAAVHVLALFSIGVGSLLPLRTTPSPFNVLHLNDRQLNMERMPGS